MAASGKNEQIVRKFFKTLSSGDLEKLRPMWHKDATWKVMVTGIPGVGEHKGRDYIIDKFLAPIRGMFKPGDPKVKITSMISKGKLVACETHTTGTFSDGRPYDNLYCWVVEIRGGLIYRLREYMDSYYIFSVIGGGK